MRPTGLGGEQVEGHHAVRALLTAGRRPVHRVWVSEGGPSEGPSERSGPVGEIMDLARGRGVPVVVKRRDALLGVSLTGTPQGVVAWAAPLAAHPLDELLEGAGPSPFLLVLDGVTDAGNFGAILRTAACAGANGVVIGRHRSAPLTPAAVKAAAGAAELVPITMVPGIPAALLALSRTRIWTAGLHPDGPEDLWRSPLLGEPVALVLGAEGSGLSRLSRERCDVLLRVPQAPGLSSLNVAAAAAVACFEVSRRRLGAVSPAPMAGVRPSRAASVQGPRGSSPGSGHRGGGVTRRASGPPL